MRGIHSWQMRRRDFRRQCGPARQSRPSASIVGENQDKIDSELRLGGKAFRPIKAVVGLEFTMENTIQNPVNVLHTIQEEFSAALAQQIDLAVLHARQASDGKVLSVIRSLLTRLLTGLR